MTVLLKQRNCMAVISHLVPSSHHTITPSLCPRKETPTEIQTASSSLFGLCLHPWPASCPWSGGVDIRREEPAPAESHRSWTGGGEGVTQRREDESGDMCWLSFQWFQCPEWFLLAQTIIVGMSYLLLEYSGMVKTADNVALPNLCGPINIYGSPFHQQQWLIFKYVVWWHKPPSYSINSIQLCESLLKVTVDLSSWDLLWPFFKDILKNL